MRLRTLPASPADLLWLEKRAGCCLTIRAKGIKAVDRSGRIRGLVAYDDFTLNSCAVHQAAESPIAWRALSPACFQYPFIQLGLGVVTGAVPASNARSLRFAQRMGFREIYRVRDGAAPGEDMVVHELRREECERRGLFNPREGAA